MGLNTDFNQAPYYDDFDENKNFHRVLFKPGVALQARELTQLQTILQNQVERFGNNILKEGTIIQGCNFTEIANLAYIKLLDLNTNGQPITLKNMVGAKIQGATTGVTGVVQTYADGLESDGVNLNTLYFKYTSSGTTNTAIKVFNNSENLYVLNSSNTLIDTITTAGSALANPADAVGKSYGVIVGDGIIYQKGFFTAVDEQLTVVSKYSNSPNNIVVGFQTAESIITSDADTSLLDNANGYNNYQAPGADRLKLTPILVAMTKEESVNDSTFFAIQEYMYGNIVRRNNDTQYSTIMSTIEKRTREESGNYTVSDFTISTSNSANTSAISLNINKGVAYVEGKRVELLNKISIDLPKATTYLTETSQSISTNYGNYILVKEYMGRFDYNLGANIALYDAYQTDATNGAIAGSPTGNSIGTAKVLSIVYDSGTIGANTAQYKMYVSNIAMNSGKKWSSVKSVVYNTNVGTADLISNTIYDQTFSRRLFTTGKDFLKTLPASATAYYTFRTVNTAVSIQNGGSNNATVSFTIPTGTGEWPYSGTLNSDQRKDFILVSGGTGGVFANNKPIDLSAATIIATNSTNIAITTAVNSGNTGGSTISNSVLYYNAKRTNIANPTAKTLDTVYVKIACNTAGPGGAASTNGPWSLGFPDVYAIDNVWVGNTAIGYQDANTASDKTSFFSLSTNQKDDYYGLSTISAKAAAGLTANSNLVVKLRKFTRSSVDGFFTVGSYPINDAVSNTSVIHTYDIPKYTSSDNTIYNLRDIVDFRLYATNTAVAATNSSDATVNPSANISFYTGNELYIPTPNKELVTDYDYYLGRKDLLMINESGDFALKSGSPAEDPISPSEPSIGMVLANIDIPPYPSLPSSIANSVKKPEYGVSLSTRNNRRYTMQDVGSIENRVQRLEYYSALNLLETDTKDLIISDASGLNRFKNGILVDNFNDLLNADLDDIEYAAGYDITNKEITPKFREYPLSIKLDNTATQSNIDTGLQYTVTLNKNTDNKLMEQPYATTSRKLAADVWSFKGQALIYPAYDGGRDTIITPEPSTGKEIYTYASGGTSLKKSGATVSATLNNSFMRPQNIRIKASGLRPNTRHYFAFDKQNISAYCAPGQYATTGDANPSNIYALSSSNTAVSSDSNGELLAVFNLPSNTFYVGERLLEIADVDDFTTLDSYVSYTATTYISYNNPNITNITNNVTNVTNVTNNTNNVTAIGSTATTTPPKTNNNYFMGEPRNSASSDPIAQTFMIRNDHGADSVVIASKLNIYFKQKSATSGHGITIEIRETDNGYPSTSKKVPLSTTYVKNAGILVSNNASIATSIVFRDPVVLRTNTEYAFVVIPDKNDPDFLIYTSKLGQKDLIKLQQVTQDTFDGTLFTSSNGRAWTPYQDENVKFALYTGYYDKSGIAYFTNNEHEFFTITPVTGSFTSAEDIIKINANNASTINANNSTNIINTSADLSSVFSAGDYLGYWANTTVIDFVRVNSANSTAIVCNWKPRYSNTSANVFKTVKGSISYYNKTSNILHIENSTSNVSNTQTYFTANDKIRGVISGAEATITSVDNLKTSLIQSNINQSNYTYTSTKFNVNIAVAANGVNQYNTTIPLSLDTDTVFNKTPIVIMSRSNEIVNGIAQSFRFSANLNNTKSLIPYDSTPIINYDASTMNVFEYLINNDSTDETKAIGGSATSKFIGKSAILAENLDASDLTTYLTAYRPPNTTIEVYVRFKNKSDPRPFNEIEWTKLSLKDSTNLVSSTANLFDYREFQYTVPTVADSTSLSNGGGAALDLSTSGSVLTYKDPNGAVYTGYKYYAIKIVLLSSSYSSIPKVKNYRAIALT